jgi:anaerobic selenocysteine-containing dehydrogenase
MPPSAGLPDEILVPGEGKLRGFITMGGNPVLSTPNGPKLEEAFEALDFMLAIDIYINETTRHADVILPNASQYTESTYYLMHIAFMVRSWVKWNEAIFPDSDGQLKGWEVMRALSARFVETSEEVIEDQFVEAWLRKYLEEGDNPLLDQIDYEQARRAVSAEPGPDRLSDVLIRTGRLGDAFGLNEAGLTVERLAVHPEGLDFGPMEPQLPAMLKTPDMKIDLVPEIVIADLARLRETLDRSPEPNAILLIGRRHQRSKNSWMHNLEMLVRGKDRCTLMMNPEDAQARGIADGDLAVVSTDLRSLQIVCEVTEDIMPGVVSIPHGWGHGQQATQMDVANRYAGVNVNAIISEAEFDKASAISVVNGIRVRVSKAEIDPVTAAAPA